MNSPARLLQKKSTDNGSTHSSWVLRTNLPFAHVVWQAGKNCHFVCVRLTPRSRRYLNITPSPGVLSLSGLRFHTSLTCTALMVTLLTPPRLSEAQPQGFLPHSSGAACTSREPRTQPACNPHPVPGAMGFRSLLWQRAAGFGSFAWRQDVGRCCLSTHYLNSCGTGALDPGGASSLPSPGVVQRSLTRRVFSTSPHGSRFTKSIPVSGVPVGGSRMEASIMRYSTFMGFI